MLRFLALYACFVGPVLKALYHETAVGVAEIKAPAADASLAAIASWYASVLGCSATLRTATRRLQLRHDRRSEAHVRSQPRLRDVLYGLREARRGGGGEDEPPGGARELQRLYELLLGCLEYEPDQRLTAADALKQPFLAPHTAPPPPA
mmetsp:Transcript_33144/g.104293  ORF Transcript_33144/g.104293 Transcript_33144/m.104293 type:complete len:149 (+) Transcript_33144:3-449(+)